MTFRTKTITLLMTGTIALGAFSAVPASAAPAQKISYNQVATNPIAERAQAAMNARGTEAFGPELDALAVAVASKLGIDSAAVQTAWRAADGEHQVALVAALSQVGVPYRRNTSKPGIGFDCSGLTTYAWGQAGFSLYRQSGVQIRNAAKVTADSAQPGDLVYYPGHVMMWLGVGSAIVHAPYTGRNVEVSFVSKRRVNRALYGDPTA